MLRIQPLETGPEADYRVTYHPPDVTVPQTFAAVRRAIRRAAGPVRVQHIGSTSIPGLGGRNVLDIAVVCDDSTRDVVKASLLAIGFQHAPFTHYLPVLVAEVLRRGREYPVLLYIVSPVSPVLVNWLAFRRYMRRHPEEVQRYDATKQLALALGHGHGDEYQTAKDPFLSAIARKIRLQTGRPRRATPAR